MKIKRYVSEATPSGQYRPRGLPAGAGIGGQGVATFGQGLINVGKEIDKIARTQYELDVANQVQEISTGTAVALGEAFYEEAQNEDPYTILERFRERANKIRDNSLEGISDGNVAAAVKSNWSKSFVSHMARLYDVRQQYWKQRTVTRVQTSLDNAAKAIINESHVSEQNRIAAAALAQIDQNVGKAFGPIKAREMRKKFLHDVEYNKMKAMIEINPLEAYQRLRRGEWPELDVGMRPQYIAEARNEHYTQITRSNAEAERQWKWWERGRKLKEDETFRTQMVKALEKSLTDEEILYATKKGWLKGDKLKAIWAFKNDVKSHGNPQNFDKYKLEIALGIPVDDHTIAKDYLSKDLSGDQAAELVQLNETMRYASPQYKAGAHEINLMFFKGPFDYGPARVRAMRHNAIMEYQDRVVRGSEDAIEVSTEIVNRYMDWKKKVGTGELLPPEYQDDPTAIERDRDAGVIGEYTYQVYLKLLREWEKGKNTAGMGGTTNAATNK